MKRNGSVELRCFDRSVEDPIFLNYKSEGYGVNVIIVLVFLLPCFILSISQNATAILIQF